MDTIKNSNKSPLSEDYLAASQLYELIGDIEQCATMLVNASKKAKVSCEKFKNRLRIPEKID